MNKDFQNKDFPIEQYEIYESGEGYEAIIVQTIAGHYQSTTYLYDPENEKIDWKEEVTTNQGETKLNDSGVVQKYDGHKIDSEEDFKEIIENDFEQRNKGEIID